MTVTAQITETKLAGNGIQTAFAFSFQIPYQSDGSTPAVIVTAIDASGNITTKSLGVDYTITGVGGTGGGVVTMTTAPASGTYITIQRNMFYTQPTAVANTSFYPHYVETGLDTLEMQIQQLATEASRSFVAPAGETIATLPAAAKRASGYLAFDSSGNPTIAIGTGTIATPLPINLGGTNATSAAAALTNLGGVASATTSQNAAGASTPVAGTTAAVAWKWESSSFTAESEGAIWTPNVYFNWVFNKEFTTGNTSGTNAPAVTLTAFAQNNNTTKDVVALVADVIGRSANVANFAANFIARNGGYNGTKLVGLEIDIEPDAATTVGAGGGGLFINAFNVAMNYPAIQTGGISGGTFSNGIALYGLATTAAGLFVGGNADSLINSTIGTFTTAAVLLGNNKARGIRLSGTAAAHAFLYNDTSNNIRMVLGSGTFVFRDNADAVSLVGISAAGNIDLTGGAGTILFASSQSATTATAGAQALPANPAGFLQVQIGGTIRKLPYYAV